MPAALVTGASRGIGADLVRGLATAGWRVAALARNEDQLRELAAEFDGDAVLPIRCDVTDAGQVSDAVERAVAAVGRIELLVNNAGLNHDEAPLWQVDADQWWAVIEANVKGPFLLTRALVPQLIDGGGGRVVNINSGVPVNDYADKSGYSASKAALTKITAATALEGAEHGIYAFDLAPGVLRTDMTAAMASMAQRTQWTDPADVLALLLALASGDLDAYSGRMVRAGVDRADDLRARAGTLDAEARRLRLRPWGDDDPLG